MKNLLQNHIVNYISRPELEGHELKEKTQTISQMAHTNPQISSSKKNESIIF